MGTGKGLGPLPGGHPHVWRGDGSSLQPSPVPEMSSPSWRLELHLLLLLGRVEDGPMARGSLLVSLFPLGLPGLGAWAAPQTIPSFFS